MQGLLHTFKRYRSLRTHRISALPIVILMPHSACNCRCVMCDIWKGNSDRKQLTHADITELLGSFRKLYTKRVVMSGGEALLNPDFFEFCALLRKAGIRVTLLSTGLTLDRHAQAICREVDEVIVSLDGDEKTHDAVHNVPGAFAKLALGVRALRAIRPALRITGRSVIHRLNYHVWPDIVEAARHIGLDTISFLAADVTSEAFNRAEPWSGERQESVLVPKEEIPVLAEVLAGMIRRFSHEFESRFIVESPEKLSRIIQYYKAHHGLAEFPRKRCNAPWVSAVVEADGSVRPCFFHDRIGNIRKRELYDMINDPGQVAYRRSLDVSKNETCKKCVCYLNLPPQAAVT